MKTASYQDLQFDFPCRAGLRLHLLHLNEENSFSHSSNFPYVSIPEKNCLAETKFTLSFFKFLLIIKTICDTQKSRKRKLFALNKKRKKICVFSSAVSPQFKCRL